MLTRLITLQPKILGLWDFMGFGEGRECAAKILLSAGLAGGTDYHLSRGDVNIGI